MSDVRKQRHKSLSVSICEIIIRAKLGRILTQLVNILIALKVCGKHLAEIDLYDFWQDRATLELELSAEDEAFTLPPFVRVLRDVTADKRYKNVNLARELPTEL